MTDSSLSKTKHPTSLIIIGVISALSALVTFAFLLSLVFVYELLSYVTQLGLSPWVMIIANFFGAIGLAIAAVFAFSNKNIRSIHWILFGYVGLMVLARIISAIDFGLNPLPFFGRIFDADFSSADVVFYLQLSTELLFYPVLASAIYAAITVAKLTKSESETVNYSPLKSGSPVDAQTFGGAIKSGFSNYVNFSGRAGRAEYWWWTLFSALVYLPLYLIYLLGIVTVVANPYDFPALLVLAGVLMVIVWLGLFLPSLAMLIRRIHDLGYSGFFYFFSFIPFAGSIIIFVFTLMPSQPQANRFGPIPSHGVSPSAATSTAPQPAKNVTPTAVASASPDSDEASAPAPASQFCGNCGRPANGKKFCQSCGTQI